MNLLTRFKKAKIILPLLIALALVVVAAAGAARAAISDFNGDGHPDFVLQMLQNANTHQTAIWYLNNNIFISGTSGPTLPMGWSVIGAADFDGDSHTDYALLNSDSGRTAIWYLSGRTFLRGAFGPTVPITSWALMDARDFNGDGHPDYVLYNAVTGQTAIWYLNNNVYVIGAFGPTFPAGWSFWSIDCCASGKWDYP